MPGLEKISKRVNACVTCDYWKGELRNPTPERLYVVYESFQRGICTGPVKRGRSMTPLNKCKAWRMWAQLNKPTDTDESIFGEQSQTWWDLEEYEEFIPDRDTGGGLKPSTYVQELISEKRSARKKKQEPVSASVPDTAESQQQAEAASAQKPEETKEEGQQAQGEG